MGIGAAAIFVAVAIFIALFNGPFAARGTVSVRAVTSVATAAFVILCAFGAISMLFAMHFFYRMVDSPKSGLTLFDARALKGKSLFSDRYLNEDGQVARGRLFAALRWFAGCWLGAVLLGLAMYSLLRGR